MGDRTVGLSGVTLITPDEVYTQSALTIRQGHITALEKPDRGEILHLDHHLVYPGLLNAHDHLFGTWWPRVAPNRPYASVYQWLADYEKSPILRERDQNSVDDMYALGVYRNMISGVTTVADHFFRMDSDALYTKHPIDVLFKYGRTWTPRKPTGWGDDIPTEYRRAVRTGQPYIIHLAEGVDQETAQEMDALTQSDAVGRNTVAIHGIALRPRDMQQMAQANASVCWCPASNLYLYSQTANIPALLKAGVNVTLGTDSTMTGGLHLLDEVRIGRQSLRTQTGEDPSPRWLVQLMTTRAAYALMLDRQRGRIAAGYAADLLILPDSGLDPYTALIEAEPADITLLLRGGVPVYGDEDYLSLFEQFTPSFTPVLVSGKPKLVAGDLPDLLNRVSENIGKPVDLPFLLCTHSTPETGAS